MGYYTQHTISAADEAGNDVTEMVMPAIAEASGYSIDDLEGEAIKWYSHCENMLAVSLAFPNYVLRVEGHGEGTGDIWVSWFQNGKSQSWAAEIVVPADPPISEWELVE